jgi:hypothetical protein
MIGRKKLRVRFFEVPRKLRLAILAMALATILIPTFLSWYDYSMWQLILAMVLLDVCSYPTFRHVARRETGLPIVPVLCIAFAVQYALPIFTQEAKIDLVNEVLYIENAAVVEALVLAILGVVALQLAYYLVCNSKTTSVIPSVSLHLGERRAEIFCVALFVISLFASRVQTMLSEETALQFSSIFTLLQNQLLVAIAILAWLTYSVRKYRRYTVMVYSLVAFTALRGFSTTMLETIILPLAVLFIGKWTFTKRLPVGSLVAIGAAFLFFSPVKMEIRRAALDEALVQQSSSSTSRATDWVAQASEFWWETLSGRRSLSESTMSASSRTDLIHQFAYMREMTPSVIPYEYGGDYYYFLVAPIPRMIWKDKPVVTASAVRFEVDYGLTTEEGAKTSTFGPTLIGEGYINFGIFGALLVMVLQGAVLGMLEHVFARKSPGGIAVFLAVFVFLLNGLGSSLVVMFGGILQSLIGSCLLLWLFSGRFGRSFVSRSTIKLPISNVSSPATFTGRN